MLRRSLMALSKSSTAREATTQFPLTREVVNRFVAGETAEQAVDVAAGLLEDGLVATLDMLGEDVTDQSEASAAVEAYTSLLSDLAQRGLTDSAEVSVKLSAIGQALPSGPKVATDGARQIARAARNAGTTMTIDMEDHTTTDATLRTLTEVRKDFPETGAVLQSHLRRTEADCRALSGAGSRVRLCKGAYDEPETVAFRDRLGVDKSYVRCLAALLEGDGYPMIATHDPRLVAIAEDLISSSGRGSDSYEFQMLYGVRPDEQLRLARAGHRVRVYIPFGEEWYPYLMRRLAERPSNVAFFLRALVSRS